MSTVISVVLGDNPEYSSISPETGKSTINPAPLTILLLALTLVYTRNVKKRQARIFEIRRKLAELGEYPGLEEERKAKHAENASDVI